MQTVHTTSGLREDRERLKLADLSRLLSYQATSPPRGVANVAVGAGPDVEATAVMAVETVLLTACAETFVPLISPLSAAISAALRAALAAAGASSAPLIRF